MYPGHILANIFLSSDLDIYPGHILANIFLRSDLDMYPGHILAARPHPATQPQVEGQHCLLDLNTNTT